jgi:hypothetical protein
MARSTCLSCPLSAAICLAMQPVAVPSSAATAITFSLPLLAPKRVQVSRSTHLGRFLSKPRPSAAPGSWPTRARCSRNLSVRGVKNGDGSADAADALLSRLIVGLLFKVSPTPMTVDTLENVASGKAIVRQPLKVRYQGARRPRVGPRLHPLPGKSAERPVFCGSWLPPLARAAAAFTAGG